MAANIKLKRSAVQSRVPTTSDLELGELGLNTYDGKVYMKKDDGTAAIVEVGGGGAGWTKGTNELYPADAGNDVLIGGTLPSAPNISLNADGTSQFEGRMDVDNIIYVEKILTCAGLFQSPYEDQCLSDSYWVEEP